MRQYRLALLLMISIFYSGGCTPSFLHLQGPHVYVRKGLPVQEAPATLTVLPFESPSYYPEVGMYTAQLFFQQLLGKNMYDVSLSHSTEWYERGRHWNGKTERALDEGRRLKSDYLLIGTIDYYMVGHITSNKVTLTIRLLEVKTGDTLYLATGTGSGKPGKTFLLLDLKAGEKTPPATSVLSAVVDHLIKDCFDNKLVLQKTLHIIPGS